jgi:hypothetical protein
MHQVVLFALLLVSNFAYPMQQLTLAEFERCFWPARIGDERVILSIDQTLEKNPSDPTSITILTRIVKEQQFVPGYATLASAYMRQNNIKKALDYIVSGAELDHPGCQYTLAQILFHSREFFDISDDLHDTLVSQAEDWLYKASSMRICQKHKSCCLYVNDKALSELVRRNDSTGSSSLDLNRPVPHIPTYPLRLLQAHVKNL